MEFASHYVYVPPLIEKPKRSGMSFHCPKVHAAELFVCLRVNENDSLWVSACIYTTESTLCLISGDWVSCSSGTSLVGLHICCVCEYQINPPLNMRSKYGHIFHIKWRLSPVQRCSHLWRGSVLALLLPLLLSPSKTSALSPPPPLPATRSRWTNTRPTHAHTQVRIKFILFFFF